MQTQQPTKPISASLAASDTPTAVSFSLPLSKIYRMRGRLLGLMLLAAACDLSGGEPVSLPGLEASPCGELDSRFYLIDEVTVPTTEAENLELGLDIDGDGQVDNHAGEVLARIASEYNGARTELQASVTAAFSSGRVGWGLEVMTCQGSGTYARVALRQMIDSDNNSLFEVRRTQTQTLDAVGSLVDGDLFAAHGSGRWPMSVLFDFADVRGDISWASGNGVTVQATVDAGTTISGRLAMGLNVTDALQAVSRPMAAFYTPRVGTGNSGVADRLDTDGDGAVSPLEFRSSTLIRIFIYPDVTLFSPRFGQLPYWPNGPGAKDHLAMGVGFHAIEVATE